MTELPWDDEPVRETDGRSRVVQALLSAAVFTPALLVEPAGEIASTEAALAAVIGGVAVGVSTSFATDGIDLSGSGDIAATVATVFAILVSTFLLFVLVPAAHMPSLLLFTGAFLWSFALTAATRQFLVPALSTSASDP